MTMALCHRCFAPRKRYLDTDEDFEVKTMRKVRQRVEFAAAGCFMKGTNRQSIVKWDPDGRNVRPGPGIVAFICIICIIHIIRIILGILHLYVLYALYILYEYVLYQS